MGIKGGRMTIEIKYECRSPEEIPVEFLRLVKDELLHGVKDEEQTNHAGE